jgi:hypothetical protein
MFVANALTAFIFSAVTGGTRTNKKKIKANRASGPRAGKLSSNNSSLTIYSQKLRPSDHSKLTSSVCIGL